MDSLRERADALSVLCLAMFGESQPCFSTVMWAATFPMEVILYALVEAALKQRRTAGITNEQLSAFAYVVMRRKWREQQRCEGVAICDLYKAVAA